MNPPHFLTRWTQRSKQKAWQEETHLMPRHTYYLPQATLPFTKCPPFKNYIIYEEGEKKSQEVKWSIEPGSNMAQVFGLSYDLK